MALVRVFTKAVGDNQQSRWIASVAAERRALQRSASDEKSMMSAGPTIEQIRLIDIFVSGERRPVDGDEVATLAESIKQIGLQTPITVRRIDRVPDPEVAEGRPYALVVGRHRLEAMRSLGQEYIAAVVTDWNQIEAKLWEIAENLHRAELTALQGADQIVLWIELSEKKKLSQVEAVSKGGRGKIGGVRAAARDLRIDKTEADRAVKIATLAPAAKATAREVGLDDNRAALLEAARQPTPEAQVAYLKTRQTNSESALRRRVEHGEKVAADVLRKVRRTHLDNDVYLDGLKKLSHQEQREKVERDIKANRKRRERRKRLPVVPPPVTDDDADRRQVDELLSVWNRTSRSARSIFLEAVGASGVRSAA